MSLVELDSVGEIDLTIDGADEIGPGFSLIKGNGAALLREKLVWEASLRCVVIADASKIVRTLGAFPLSIEVVAFGHTTTLRRITAGLADCGIIAAPRLRRRDGELVVTDSGNLIYDAPCGAILDPVAVEAALKSITGVVRTRPFSRPDAGSADRNERGRRAPVAERPDGAAEWLTTTTTSSSSARDPAACARRGSRP